ncbi:endoribonuclease L-PSP [Massilibacteroides sp.]|uniref:chorismate transformation enzyme, FkbO/Hyg5 family n=1 Tax=Massilibacteroides sp. TaxID=2034766 RepID=UPI0026366055|nr:endoribonuclease L-PSP [Massilibacteroides sp.]MDD4516850.1 endoribonuclease L-PSP [Massilibacteroides sp.]
MSYCNNIRYHLLTTTQADFPTMVADLLEQLPANETILRLAFFGTPADNQEYVIRRSVLFDQLKHYFGADRPVLSYVSQPPLNTPLLLEVHSYLPEKDDTISYRSEEGLPYVILENQRGRFLFAGGFQGDVMNTSIHEQSGFVFNKIERLLHKEGFPINSIVRQWNYIEQITFFDEKDQHYQSFNNARAAFYKKTEWPLGYPAATGIGANLGGILIDFDAVVIKHPKDVITPIDNRLQVSAHAYSKEVLKNASEKKETPKFERAKSLTISEKRLVYISGTAAIRGEDSLKNVGVEEQLRITMENIAELTGDSNLSILRVYIKHKDDFSKVEALMNKLVPEVPVSYMWADVCRDELLIEIEGISID